MSKKSLTEVFEINNNTNYNIEFDKELLNNMKNNIMHNICNKKIPRGISNKDFINNEISSYLKNKDISELSKTYLYDIIDNEINGMGPITELLNDENVTHIMVNSTDEIYISVDGKMYKEDNISFINDEHIYKTINKFLVPLNSAISSSNPIVNVRLSNGSYMSAVVPPISSNPIFTIKKNTKNIYTLEDYLSKGVLTPYMAIFLEAIVKANLNIVVTGMANTGKTTLLNILGSLVNDKSRLVVIEENKEILLKKDNIIKLKVDNNNNINDLINTANNFNVDTFLVDKIDKSSVDNILTIMNDKIINVITSLTCKDHKEGIDKIERLLNLNVGVKKRIASSIDIIINIEKLVDGRIKITSISEIDEITNQGIKLRNIFAYRKKLIDNNIDDGEFVLYKYIPKIYKKIKSRGVDCIDEIFGGCNEI